MILLGVIHPTYFNLNVNFRLKLKNRAYKKKEIQFI